MKISKQQYNQLREKVDELEKLINGGKGSGNFGHAGRPGKVGGSAPEGGGGNSSEGKSAKGEPMKLASFMQLAKETPLEFKQVSFHGGEPRNADWRDVTQTQTKSIKLGDSWLDLPKASLVEIEWDGEKGTMKCYDAGFRDYNDEEKKALAAWEKISSTDDYNKRAQVDALTDGSSTYYQEKAFWEDRGMPYMFHTYSQGKYRTQNPDKKDKDGHYVYEIRDDSIKGKIWGEYEFRKKDGGEKNSFGDITVNGGKGSGNFGHAGRPGEIGGSAPEGAHGQNPTKRLLTRNSKLKSKT